MKYLHPNIALVLASVFLLVSCKKEVHPKPDGYLRLEYPAAHYQKNSAPCAFTFEQNDQSRVDHIKNCSFQIDYPQMKGRIYVDYKQVTKNNLDSLLRDAQKLTYNHTIKAEDIQEDIIYDPNKKVYGMFYQLIGNTATNVQFYATDSSKNFIVGSLYFYAKPNYDSILPAAHYIRADMLRMVESLEWK